MSRLVISLGSNMSRIYIDKAILWLSSILENIRTSSIYETPPAKGPGRPYDNAVLLAETDIPFDELNDRLKIFEADNGRNAEARSKGEVTIDLDIVLWNGDILRPWDFRQNFFRIGFAELETHLARATS